MDRRDPGQRSMDQVENTDERQIPPWDAWDNYIDGCGQAEADAKLACAAAVRAHVPSGPRDDFIPAMPTVSGTLHQHRPKLGRRMPVNACVARPVGKAERQKGSEAYNAMVTEWSNLRNKGTWGSRVREWSAVAAEAKAANQDNQ